MKHKPCTFLSIDKWTSAFIIFTSIMLEKYRFRVQEFLKYMRDVRLAADRSGNGWFTYDEQFRLRKVSDPHSSWGIINSELWLIHVTNNYTMQTQEKPIPPTQNFFPQHKHPNIPAAKKKVNSAPNRYWYDFNSGKSCKFYPNCRFVHSCNSCGWSHPSIKCRNRNTNSNQDINSLGKTPIDVYNLSAYLHGYSAKSFLINGFLHGFKLQYNGPRIYRESKNLKSAIVNPSIVEHKIHKELLLQRVGGPFEYPPFPSLQISPLGLVPKKDGDFRLIHPS